MNLLLDTHTLLWFLWNDARLSANARSLIVDPQNQKFVSLASCWEIAIKVGMGKLSVGEPTKTFLPRELARNNFDQLPIALDHVTAVESLPLHHRDPFDRLLIAQSLLHHFPLVSADPVLDPYGLTRLW